MTISNDAIAKVLQREYERGLTRAYKVLPFANREFRGDISEKWDTVIVPTIQISGWNKWGNPNGPVTPWSLNISSLKLKIEQYYDIRLVVSDKDISLLWKDLKTAQKIVELMREDAKTIQENYFIEKLLEVDSKVTSPVILTGANIYSEIVRIQVEMDKKNIPEDKRKLFVSPLIAGIIQDSKKLENFEAGYKKVSSWEMWILAGFTIVKTNALKDENEKKLIWYQDEAGAFVEKLDGIKVKEASDGNYTNIVGKIFFDAGVLGENKKRICIYEGA